MANKILFCFGLKPNMCYYNTLLGVRRQFHSQGRFLVLVHTFWFFSVEWGRVWESTRASPHCALDPGWKEARGSAHTHTGLGTDTHSLHLQCCCDMGLGQMVDISICIRFQVRWKLHLNQNTQLSRITVWNCYISVIHSICHSSVHVLGGGTQAWSWKHVHNILLGFI